VRRVWSAPCRNGRLALGRIRWQPQKISMPGALLDRNCYFSKMRSARHVGKRILRLLKGERPVDHGRHATGCDRIHHGLQSSADPTVTPCRRCCCITIRGSPSWNCRFWRKAVVSQANRKHLRWTVHSDLNRVPTAGRLWCTYVAPRVSVDCYRPIAAAGRRASCAGS
jgi:hypothetical protein